MKICLILEGSYPYVHGGVSTWMHQYITEMKEHEFVLWVVGATHEQKGKFVYELPENVVEVHEVFLDYVVPDKEEDIEPHQFTDEEKQALKDMVFCQQPDWKVSEGGRIHHRGSGRLCEEDPEEPEQQAGCRA